MTKVSLTDRILTDTSPPPAASVTEILSDLRKRGFRITKIRQSMLESLAAASQPISAPELLQTIAKEHASVNKTTIYRELDFLAHNGIIAEIDVLEGMKRYELLHPDHHHHHLVCTSCRDIQCVEVSHHELNAIENKIQTTHKFTVKSHVLEFFGLCSKCSNS